MTNPTPHGQVPAIQRYKIGYHSDEWGVRSSTPGGIYDDAGPWVLYKDHAAVINALRAYCQELESQVFRDCMTHVQNPAEIEHVAGDVSKNGAEANMTQQPAQSAAAEWTRDQITAFCNVALRNVELVDEKGPTLAEVRQGVAAALDAAPQPSPTAQADSQPCSFGSPELQAMILAKCVEKDRAARAPADSVLEDAARATLFTTPYQRGEMAGDGKPCNNDHDPDCRWPDCICRHREARFDAARKQGGAT